MTGPSGPLAGGLPPGSFYTGVGCGVSLSFGPSDRPCTMLKLMRRLLRRGPAPVEPLALEQWARSCGHQFRRVRSAAGCVIDGQFGAQAWRIEWGASQRSYIPGFELRLIAELGLPKGLMCMVLNRSLMAAMEKEKRAASFYKHLKIFECSSGTLDVERAQFLL